MHPVDRFREEDFKPGPFDLFQGFFGSRADGGLLEGLRQGLLGGSWVVIGGVISPLIWVITIVTLLITPLIAHEPPSTPRDDYKGLLQGMPYGLLTGGDVSGLVFKGVALGAPLHEASTSQLRWLLLGGGGVERGLRPKNKKESLELQKLCTYSLHCSSFFWFNQIYIKDPKQVTPKRSYDVDFR